MIEKIRRFVTAGAEVFQSRLGVSALVFVIFYILLSIFVPVVWLVELGNALILAFSVLLAFIWLPDAIWSIRKGETDSQFFTLGMALIFIWIVNSRVWSNVWRWLGHPEWMINHPWTAFMLFVLVFGLAMLVAAPGAAASAIPKNWRMIVGAIALGIFLLGATLGSLLTSQIAPDNYTPINTTPGIYKPQCAPENPIKGNSTAQGQIYHKPDSLYYPIVSPIACFPDEKVAKDYGFREPKKPGRKAIQG